MNEPCRFCGSTRFGHTNVTLDGSRVPACCWDCALCAQHMPVLGHAIARFVRRSEVHAMREIVLDALDNSESVPVEDYVAATRCLRLLAEMAMGEVSGG